MVRPRFENEWAGFAQGLQSAGQAIGNYFQQRALLQTQQDALLQEQKQPYLDAITETRLAGVTPEQDAQLAALEQELRGVTSVEGLAGWQNQYKSVTPQPGETPSLGSIFGEVEQTSAPQVIGGIAGLQEFLQSGFRDVRTELNQLTAEDFATMDNETLQAVNYFATLAPSEYTPELLQQATQFVSAVKSSAGKPTTVEGLGGRASELLRNADELLQNPAVMQNPAVAAQISGAQETLTRFSAGQATLDEFLGAQTVITEASIGAGLDANAAQTARDTLDEITRGWSATTPRSTRLAQLAPYKNSSMWALLTPTEQQAALIQAGIEDPAELSAAALDRALAGADAAERARELAMPSLLATPEARTAFGELTGVDMEDPAAVTTFFSERRAEIGRVARQEAEDALYALVDSRINTTQNGIDFLAENYTPETINSIIENRDSLPPSLAGMSDLLTDDDLIRAAARADARITAERLNDPLAKAAYDTLTRIIELAPQGYTEADRNQALQEVENTLVAAGYRPEDQAYQNWLMLANASFDAAGDEALTAGIRAGMNTWLVKNGYMPLGSADDFATRQITMGRSLEALESQMVADGCMVIDSIGDAIMATNQDTPVCQAHSLNHATLTQSILDAGELQAQQMGFENLFVEGADGQRLVDLSNLTASERVFLFNTANDRFGGGDQGALVQGLNDTADLIRAGRIKIDEFGKMIGPSGRVTMSERGAPPASLGGRPARGDGGVTTYRITNDGRFGELLEAVETVRSADVTSLPNPLENEFANRVQATGVPADEFSNDVNAVVTALNGTLTREDARTIQGIVNKYRELGVNLPDPADSLTADNDARNFLSYFQLDFDGNVRIPQDIFSNRRDLDQTVAAAEAQVTRLTRALVTEYGQSAFDAAYREAVEGGAITPVPLFRPEAPGGDGEGGGGGGGRAASATVTAERGVEATDVLFPSESTVAPETSPSLTTYALSENVVDPVRNVIGALIQQESNGLHRNIVTGELTESPSEALGITQIMPETAWDPGFGLAPLVTLSREDDARVRQLRAERKIFIDREDEANVNALTRQINAIIKPYMNEKSETEFIRFGGDYLNGLYDYYSDYQDPLSLALAAYNGGAGNVDNALRRGGERNFLAYMPKQETRDYVPAVLRKAGM